MAEQLSDRGGDEHYRAPRASLSLADFELLRRIGDGSYSQVVLARHRASGREFALKIVDKHFIMRHKVVEHVKRERALLDRLAYDGIVRLHFTFQDALSLYMGLEHCPNGELYDQIRLRGRLDEAATRFYAAEMVLMLEALRQEGVVHRDFKPENLLLTQEGHLKLIDFGSAKQLGPEDVVPSRPAGQPSQQQAEPGAGVEAGAAGGSEASAGEEAAAAAAAAPGSQLQEEHQGPPPADGSVPQEQQQQQQQPQQGLDGTASSSQLAGLSQPAAGSSTGGAAGSSRAYGESPFSSSAGGALEQQQQQQQGQQVQQQGAHEEGGLGESSSDSDDGQVEAGGGQLSKRSVSLVGTADYVSPEVLRNEQVSCAADLWALGCVLYQMLVGRPPFKSGSEYLTFQQILEGSVEMPAHVPPHAADLIRRLLASDPAQRIGAFDLGEIKAHPFFEGVGWEGLRTQPAPAFTPPELDMHDSDTGSFDWELQSLSAALPQLSGNVWQYESTGGRSSEDD